MRSSSLLRLVAITSSTFLALSYPFDILPNDLIQAAVTAHVPEHQDVVEQGIRPVGEERGWLGRWLALGGEGEVNVPLSDHNLTFPHRPAAFPTNLPRSAHLPLSGHLLPFTSFISADDSSSTFGPKATPIQACLAAHWPPIRSSPSIPARGRDQPQGGVTRRIALVERGGCDFAMKVYAAQERGASAVIVGDTALQGEGREEGLRRKGGLITMFSPEDTENIHIPSVFISRSAFLQLMDMFNSSSILKEGIFIEISDGGDESATLSSMLSFALLMPSCFLLATIAIHRLRAARQKEADRAPALVVLSLPERVWQPDIVWEKEDDTSSGSFKSSRRPSPQRSRSQMSLLPPISAKDLTTPPAVEVSDPLDTPTPGPSTSRPGAPRRKSSRATITKKRYFSKDECAICMDEFHAGDIVRILPCGHVFHKEECDEWLLKWRKLCPTCRADVTLPPGANVQGASVTPVHGVTTDEDEDLPENVGGLRSAMISWLVRSRQRLFGRQQRDNQTETTPLLGVQGGRTDGNA